MQANSAWLNADSLINNAHFSKIDERAGVRISQSGGLASFSLKAGLTCAITKRAVNLCLNSASGQAPEIGFGLSGRGCFPDLESPSPQARLDQQKGKFNAIAHRGLGGILVERHG
jgi:hypothetical protein